MAGNRGGIVEYVKPAQTQTLTAGGTITGGQIVELSANRTVIATSGTSRKVAGVALHDAVVGEAVTVATLGVWPIKATGAIAFGDQLISAAAGTVSTLADAATAVAADINNARSVIAQAQESISNAATGRVRLRG